MTEVLIYESRTGSVEVRLEHDTVWLRQEQLAELFGRDRTVIGRHIRNVFKEGELDEEANVQNLHIATSAMQQQLSAEGAWWNGFAVGGMTSAGAALERS